MRPSPSAQYNNIRISRDPVAFAAFISDVYSANRLRIRRAQGLPAVGIVNEPLGNHKEYGVLRDASYAILHYPFPTGCGLFLLLVSCIS